MTALIHWSDFSHSSTQQHRSNLLVDHMQTHQNSPCSVILIILTCYTSHHELESDFNSNNNNNIIIVAIIIIIIIIVVIVVFIILINT